MFYIILLSLVQVICVLENWFELEDEQKMYKL